MAEIKTPAELVEALQTKLTDNLKAIETKAAEFGAKGEEALKLAKEVKDALANLPAGITAEQLEAKAKEIQDQFDTLATKSKMTEKQETKSLGEAIGDAVKNIDFKEQVENDLMRQLHKDRGVRLELKGMPDFTKNETIAGSLTGDQVRSYSTRQGIAPAQKINFRDLIPTTLTETGLYAFYRENSGIPNNIAKQLEGSLKAENNYAFTEVKVVQQYIAGFTTFSKQMMTSLPWLQNTLPRMLMRDYFKQENALFFATVSSAATSGTSIETDNFKRILDFINAQRDLNYDPAFGLVSNADMGKLLKLTYTNGYYAGAGGVNIVNNATGVTINGLPVLPASWVTPGRILIIDDNFIERVQVKGLVIDLSYENNDNFLRNMVTARIECQTEINLLLNPSALYGTLN